MPRATGPPACRDSSTACVERSVPSAGASSGPTTATPSMREVGVDVATFDQLVARAPGDPGDGARRRSPGACCATRSTCGEGLRSSGLESLPFVSTQATRLERGTRSAALGDRVDADLAAGHHREVIAELESIRGGPSVRGAVLGAADAGAVPVGVAGRRVALLLAAADPAQRRARHRPGPDVSPIWNRRSSTKIPRWPGRRGAHPPLHPPQGRCRNVAPVTTGTRPGDDRIDRPTRTQRHDRDARTFRGCHRSGAAAFVGRHPELELARAARRRAAVGRTALDAHHRGARHRQDETHGRDRARVRRRRRSGAPRPMGRGAAVSVPGVSRSARSLLAAGPRGSRRAPTSAPWLRCSVRIVPEVLEGQGRTGPSGPEVEGDRYQVFDAVNRWIRAIAGRRRLVLVLDDMHWADRPSLLLARIPPAVVDAGTGADRRHLPPDRQQRLGMVLGVTGRHPPHDIGREHRPRRVCRRQRPRSCSKRPSDGTLERPRGGRSGQPPAPHGRQPVLLAGGGPGPARGGAVARGVVGGERRRAAPARTACATSCAGAFASCRPSCMRVLSAASALGDEFDIGTVGDAIDCDEETLLLALDEARLAGVVTESSREFDTHSLHPRRRPPGAVPRARPQPPDPAAPATRQSPREPLRRRRPPSRRASWPTTSIWAPVPEASTTPCATCASRPTTPSSRWPTKRLPTI